MLWNKSAKKGNYIRRYRQSLLPYKKMIVKSLIPKEAIYDLRRFRLALSELLESGASEATHVYLLGALSANCLSLKFPENCREHVKSELEKSMRKIAGVYGVKELREKIEIAQRAINILKKNLKTNSF